MSVKKGSNLQIPNLLVICYGVGGASGFVFERMIKELSKYYYIDLWVSAVSNNLKSLEESNNLTVNVQEYLCFPNFLLKFLKKKLVIVDNGYLHLNDIFQKYLIKIFGRNILNRIWTMNLYRKIKKSQRKYDAVLGLMDYNGFACLEATVGVSKKLQTKSIIYSTDANPVTPQWDNDKHYLKKASNLLSKYFHQLNGIFFANEKMLEYEDKIFQFNKEIHQGVVYTVSPRDTYQLPNSSEKVFLYTGVLWGPRKVNYLFRAFKKLLNVHPDAKLCFVGTRKNGFSDEELSIFTDEEKKSIVSEPPTTNLLPYFEKALCLVDINADYEGDPFLSSKITNYIKYNRPILCEASLDSPARLIFSKYKTIYICNHSSDELFKAMCEIIDESDFDFEERKELINKFSVNSVIHRFSEDIQAIIES